MSDYESKLQQVQFALQSREIKIAYNMIATIMKQNMSLAEPHNLLGIYYEIVGDDNKALKHYRAAYALDPAYKPACHNLERLVTWHWGQMPRDFDFGQLSLAEKQAPEGDE